MGTVFQKTTVKEREGYLRVISVLPQGLPDGVEAFVDALRNVLREKRISASTVEGLEQELLYRYYAELHYTVALEAVTKNRESKFAGTPRYKERSAKLRQYSLESASSVSDARDYEALPPLPLVGAEAEHELLFYKELYPLLDHLLGEGGRRLFIKACEILQELPFYFDLSTPYARPRAVRYLEDAIRLMLCLIDWRMRGISPVSDFLEKVAEVEAAKPIAQGNTEEVWRYYQRQWQRDWQRWDIDHYSLLWAAAIELGEGDELEAWCYYYGRLWSKHERVVYGLVMPMVLRSADKKLFLYLDFNACQECERHEYVLLPMLVGLSFSTRALFVEVLGSVFNDVWKSDPHVLECLSDLTGENWESGETYQHALLCLEKGIGSRACCESLVANLDPVAAYMGLFSSLCVSGEELWVVLHAFAQCTEIPLACCVVLGHFLASLDRTDYHEDLAHWALRLHPESALVVTLYLKYLIVVPSDEAVYEQCRKTQQDEFEVFTSREEYDQFCEAENLKRILALLVSGSPERLFETIAQALDSDTLSAEDAAVKERLSFVAWSEELLDKELAVWALVYIAQARPALARRVIPYLRHIDRDWAWRLALDLKKDAETSVRQGLLEKE